VLLGAALLYYGIGPEPSRGVGAWWAPRNFLLGEVPGDLLPALAVLVGPLLGLAAAVFWTTTSSLLAALAVFGVVAASCFVFYGIQAPGVWSFFHWRWSACMLLFSALVAAAGTAPLLAASWRRRRPWLRWLLYLPLFLAVVALERNVTGTDPNLPFALSPWPVVPVLGLEVAGSALAALEAGLALGVLGLARRTRTPRILGVLAGAALPVGLLALASWADLLPFHPGRMLFAATGVLAFGLLAAAALPLRGMREALSARGRHLALGAVLLAAPLATGQVLIRLDYSATRNVRAQRILDALQAFYEREQRYPDKLQELVDAELLPAIPRPQIGFSWLSHPHFVYQNFGDSYLLEFSAPRWMQCAYNPPWTDDEAELDEESEEGATLGGAWSCPSKPPELW